MQLSEINRDWSAVSALGLVICRAGADERARENAAATMAWEMCTFRRSEVEDGTRKGDVERADGLKWGSQRSLGLRQLQVLAVAQKAQAASDVSSYSVVFESSHDGRPPGVFHTGMTS